MLKVWYRYFRLLVHETTRHYYDMSSDDLLNLKFHKILA